MFISRRGDDFRWGRPAESLNTFIFLCHGHSGRPLCDLRANYTNLKNYDYSTTAGKRSCRGA